MSDTDLPPVEWTGKPPGRTGRLTLLFSPATTPFINANIRATFLDVEGRACFIKSRGFGGRKDDTDPPTFFFDLWDIGPS